MSDETKDVAEIVANKLEWEAKYLDPEDAEWKREAAEAIRTLRSKVASYMDAAKHYKTEMDAAYRREEDQLDELERKDAALRAILDYGDIDHEGLTADQWDKVHGPTWGDVSRAEIARRALAPVAEQEASDE